MAPASPNTLTRQSVAGRVAWLGLAIVLVVLTAFTIWSTTSSSQAAKELKRSRLVTDAFVRARFAIDEERLIEHRNALGHDGNYSPAKRKALHTEFNRAARAAKEALVQLSVIGDVPDRKLAARLLERQLDYHSSMEELFKAAEMGRSQMAMMNGSLAGQDFDELEARLTATTRAKSDQTLRRLGSLESLAGHTRLATLVVIPFALGLFVLFAAVLRAYRRREEEAMRAEVSRLEREALVDSLTHLRNHRAWEEDLAHDLARAGRSGQPLTLVLLDLDNLKQVNDSLGHQVGDERLRALAEAMRHGSRDSDRAYRIGGDEFALIISDARAWDALAMVERVQDELKRTTAGVQTVTAGVAEAGPGIERDELIQEADVALLSAKATHCDALVYSPELRDVSQAQSPSLEREGFEAFAAMLVRAVDARDSAMQKHAETVANLCVLIGTQLGLDDERVSKLRLAGLFHDVGKVGIPDSVLRKPGPLDHDEFELMKTHSRVGHGIIAAAGLADEARFVLHHHERIDGHGYPGGLVGDEVPLESRILFVADAYEAMTADRSYRNAMSEEMALAELEANAGTQFDADSVAALRVVVATRGGRLLPELPTAPS